MESTEFQARSARLEDGTGDLDLHTREARSQALFREVNERIEELSDGFGALERDSFVCECGNPRCMQTIALTRAQYERVRQHASRFVVALDHENPETETIVEQNDCFAVVETYAGEASQIARETDPRSQANTRAKRARDPGAETGRTARTA